jgi:hypothetical protein
MMIPQRNHQVRRTRGHWFPIADIWFAGSNHDVLNLADTWSSGSDEDSGEKPSVVPEPGPAVLDLADTWFASDHDAEASELSSVPAPGQSILNFADSWVSGSDHNSGPELSGPPEASIIDLANTWLGDEEADDEETGSMSSDDDGTGSENVEAPGLEKDKSPGSEVAPGRSQASFLAEIWNDNESSVGPREGDWSYGGEHFSDLKADMFVNSSDEEL